MSNNTQTQELRALLAKVEKGLRIAAALSCDVSLTTAAMADLEGAIAAHTALLDHIERLQAALRGLEDANEALCATRSQVTYDFMVDHDQAQPELEALDDARRAARLALEQQP